MTAEEAKREVLNVYPEAWLARSFGTGNRICVESKPFPYGCQLSGFCKDAEAAWLSAARRLKEMKHAK